MSIAKPAQNEIALLLLPGYPDVQLSLVHAIIYWPLKKSDKTIARVRMVKIFNKLLSILKINVPASMCFKGYRSGTITALDSLQVKRPPLRRASRNVLL